MTTATYHGDRIQAGDLIRDRDGRDWRFAFITQDRKVFCRPYRTQEVPGVLDPQLFPALAIVED